MCIRDRDGGLDVRQNSLQGSVLGIILHIAQAGDIRRVGTIKDPDAMFRLGATYLKAHPPCTARNAEGHFAPLPIYCSGRYAARSGKDIPGDGSSRLLPDIQSRIHKRDYRAKAKVDRKDVNWNFLVNPSLPADNFACMPVEPFAGGQI